MQSEASNNERLIVHGDGTVTDTETDLMWTTAAIGKNQYGKICEMAGDMSELTYGLTWYEATKLFGKGRKRPLGPLKDGLSSETYEGYEFAQSCQLRVGNYDDWRLPTVEECKTLLHESESVYETFINTKVFGESRPDLWTATFSQKEQGSFYAWEMHYGYTVGTTECQAKRFVLLVRSGAAFNAWKAESTDCRRSRDGNWFGRLFRTD